MLSCSHPQAPRADLASIDGGIAVLELSAPVYDPAGARGDGPALEAQCKAWSLTREQAQAFFRLATSITGEQRHAHYSSLPCTIRGRLQAEGRIWAFSINAAATADWTSGEDTRSFGCADPACEPLVLLMPEADGG